ncbi:hypothetical protein ACQPYV_09335 [Micromonospora saelicesensis]|uniref:hypothetical protein n=1 Tax=Micromonospora saelicesensis TaxID=285676 RepID=UPI0011BEB669|nr:hypothetical protein [Micromonospora saelicesensis]
MDDSSLDLDPDGLLQVARGIGDLAQRLLSVEAPSGEEALMSWIDELPRIGLELHEVERLLRELARSAAAADDELAARFVQQGEA